jgi:hypothetical protein
MMANPGGYQIDEVLGILNKMVKAMESPNGTDSAQNDVAPLFMAYLMFIKEGGKSTGIAQTVLNQNILVSPIKRFFRMEVSLAQKYSGPYAPAVNLSGTKNILDQALIGGTLRKEGRKEYFHPKTRPEAERKPEFPTLAEILKEIPDILMRKQSLSTLTNKLFRREIESTDVYARFKKKFNLNPSIFWIFWLSTVGALIGTGAGVDFAQKTAKQQG